MDTNTGIADGMLSVNLFVDTFDYADSDSCDAVVEAYAKANLCLNYRMSAIFTRPYLLNNFPNNIMAISKYDIISKELYEKLVRTVVILHINESMPDLSGVELSSEFFDGSSWRALIAEACRRTTRGEEFCIGAKLPYHNEVSAALMAKKLSRYGQLHIYFGKEAKMIYNSYG